MKTKRGAVIFGILAGLGLLGLGIVIGGAVDTNSVSLPGPQIEHLSSLNGVLFELAAERQETHYQKGEKWIFTFHSGQRVKKFSDKHYVVISLPVEQERFKVGLCAYIRQYNGLTSSLVDKEACEGNYAQARRYYKVLLHFDRCGGLTRETIQKKLDCLERVLQNKNSEETKRQYAELCIPLAGHWNLFEIESVQPLVVTNLLNVELP